MSEEDFIITKVKNTVPLTYVINDHKSEETVQGFIFVVENGEFRRRPWWILPKFAGACFSEKKKKKKKKKSSTNVLGVVLRYLLTKIFLAAKSPSRNNNSQDR